jgi:hypothetical protein
MSTSYGLAALEKECIKSATTRSGRNAQLYVSSFSLGQLVGGGELDRTVAEQRLFDAAEACGYVTKDGAIAARSTIRSGLDGGERNPRAARNVNGAASPSPSFHAIAGQGGMPIRRPDPDQDDDDRIKLAQRLWSARKRLDERYLRQARGLSGPFPATLGFLPARGEYPPSIIAAFGVATEPEPGVLAINDTDVYAVHITKLTADGTAKASAQPNKIMIGRSKGSPIVLAPPNDLLTMCITEGIEDALSAHEAMAFGAWAAGSAPLMPSLADAVPDYVEHVLILAHRDPAGIKAANELARRLCARAIPCTVAFLGLEAAA